MKDSQQANYFKIGSFVLAGLAVFVILIVLFTSLHVFSKTFYVETYFNESVQGLSVGSPVKYRGITIGHVKKISFVAQVYPLTAESNQYGRYIYVLIEITSSFLTNGPSQVVDEKLKKDVEDGLRAKLALADLTGNAYLEINFTNPKQNPALPVSWVPEHPYIPSTVSVLTRFTDSVQNILEGLQKVNFPKFFNNAQDLMGSTNETMNRVDTILQRTQSSIVGAARGLETTSNNLRSITTNIKNNPSSILFDKPRKVDPSSL